MKRLGWFLALVALVWFVLAADSGWAWVPGLLMWVPAVLLARAYEAENRVAEYSLSEACDVLD